ncbi:MAG: aldose 1-epimerase family protein [Cyclobacteriaceae bacterium]
MTKAAAHYHLKKGGLSAEFSAFGAECTSLTYKGREYLWQADPAIWGRHAPVLFPFVGRLKGNTFIHQGASYTMGQHGFARDRKFQLADQDENSLTFVLVSDAQSLEIFPFHFQLFIRYTLTEAGMKVGYKVVNPSSCPLLYSIGAHPGFNCPLDPEEEAFSDYEIDFMQAGLSSLSVYLLEDGLIGDKKAEIPLHDGKLPLSYSLFENDALIMDVGAFTQIQIRSKITGRGFIMDFSDFRWLGLWSKNKDAGFICIEPWNGIADTLGHDLQLENKWGIQKLEAHQYHEPEFEVGLFS